MRFLFFLFFILFFVGCSARVSSSSSRGFSNDYFRPLSSSFSTAGTDSTSSIISTSSNFSTPAVSSPAVLSSVSSSPLLASSSSTLATTSYTNFNNFSKESVFLLLPASDVAGIVHPGDAGPSQWFEIIRPGGGNLRVGRLSTSCTCISARISKREFSSSERALVEVRILKRPDRGSLTYVLFVNILEPREELLTADVTVSSK